MIAKQRKTRVVVDFVEYTSRMLYGIQSRVRLNRPLEHYCANFLYTSPSNSTRCVHLAVVALMQLQNIGPLKVLDLMRCYYHSTALYKVVD